jgi:transcriptional regulator with PAS, ATPase and Fis domain
MPLGTQARLLRVLENGEYIRVGSSKVLKTNVRVVAATNVNLLDAVNNGKFREDLYYRLNTVPIYVPPLRDRGEDILLLVQESSRMIFRKDTAPNQSGWIMMRVILLMQYPFPGNIRQLKNIAEQITILETDKELPITSDTLNHYLNPVQPAGRKALITLRTGEERGESFSERELLYKVLFDMRRDMTELKKLVRNVLENEKYGGDILKDHQELFSSLNNNGTESTTHTPTIEPSRDCFLQHPREPLTWTGIPTKEVKLRMLYMLRRRKNRFHLEDKEKEMIIKALRKNNNKRKYAANALGISERTLYRKIKQYDIEE